MSCNQKSSAPVRRVVRAFATLLVTCAALLAAPQAFAADAGDIVVVSSKGEVVITVGGAARNVRAGGVLELPATVRTGADGSVELKQGATTVSVGPETLLEFPALEKRGAPIDRIVQPRGNAFYDIGKRKGRKLRVETPYLVGVIKGTQFNVAVQDGATTISLFEGLLEVRASDDSDGVDLVAGEIATRRRGDRSINIIKMDAGKTPPAPPRASPGIGLHDDEPPFVENSESLLVDHGAAIPRMDVDSASEVRPGASLVETGVSAAVDTIAGADVNLGSTGIAVDVAAQAAADVGPSGTDVAITAGIDLGPADADLGVSNAVDLGAGTIDATAATTVDAGPLTTDLGVDAAIDLGSGTVDTGVDVGVSTPVADVDAGAAAVVDVIAGTVDLDVDVAGLDLDLGVDLGLDDGNNGHGNDASGTDSGNPGRSENSSPGNIDLGDALNGLLRRPGRR